MANWNGTARSNYFFVKDFAAFTKWVTDIDCVVLVGEGDQTGMFGFYSNDDNTGSWPSYRCQEDEDGCEIEDEDFDLPAELAEHLAEGQVAVLVEAGAEKMRYISGWAKAVTWDGRSVQINLDNIYDMAQAAFGITPTDASY
jgi:hypothetical protein